MKKIFVAIVLIMLVIILFSDSKAKETIQYDEYTISAGDTFWGIYCERYSDKNYGEALYNFKQDNNMKTCDLQVGQVVKLRK